MKNVVVMVCLPINRHASIQAIEANSNTDTKKLVTYWIIFSLISLFEHAFTGILQWLPFWPYVKLTIVCWTMIPHFDGAFYLYNHFVHPCLYMDLPTIINWFKKAQDLFLKDNFLEVADDCVKTRGPTEVQEKLIANEVIFTAYIGLYMAICIENIYREKSII